jgi:hypothetical protein
MKSSLHSLWCRSNKGRLYEDNVQLKYFQSKVFPHRFDEMPNHSEQERALDFIGRFENRLQQGEYKHLPRTTETTSGGEDSY